MKINGLSATSLSRQIAEVCEYLFGHRNNSNIHVSAAQKYIWNNKINNPSNEGSNGDMLVTDGNGGRSWSALPTATKDNKGLVIGNYTAVDEYPLGIDADGMVCVPIADGEDGGIVKADGETLTCTDGEMSVNTNAIQPKLVSGTNIKTINNQSLLGSGNIVIQGGGGEVNVIEVVKRNGTPLEVTNKAVDVSVPTQPSDIGAQPLIDSANKLAGNLISGSVASANSATDWSDCPDWIRSSMSSKPSYTLDEVGDGDTRRLPYVPTFTINTFVGGTYTSEQLAGFGITADILDDMSGGLLTRCKIGSYIYEIVGVYGTKGVDMEFQLLYRNYLQDTGLYLYWNGSGYTAQVVSR